MPLQYLFLPFKGTFEFVLVPGPSTPSDGILLETGDFLFSEDGSYITQE